ncbi:MAG: hypothetical protein EB830_04615 [Nitrosopumilus sp. H13]|nr:MAG: hypothetical protein EB830_04615 [Nitrosopumilus sp. H13]
MSDEISAMLDSESAKLAKLIDAVHPGIAIREIIETYYQIMNVTSIIAMLGQRPGAADLSEKIKAADESISRFNAEVHPMISRRLDDSISDIKAGLESGESDSYDELRKMMSTREFVGQYETGLA